MRARTGLWCFGAWIVSAAASACVRDVDAPSVGTSSAAIHGVSDIDHDFSAVGIVKLAGGHACSGTLVAPNVVLTASHCVEAYAQGCQSLHDALDGLQFAVYPLGERTLPDPSANTFQVDGIAINPRAIAPKLDGCEAAGATASCAASAPNFGLRLTNDMALLHLATSPDAALVGSSLPRVLTSISDAILKPHTAHFSIDGASVFGGGSVKPQIVGWGYDDQPCSDFDAGIGAPDQLSRRHSGYMLFKSGADWNRSCSQFWTCGSNGPVRIPAGGGTTPCPFDVPDFRVGGLSTWYLDEGLQLDRATTTNPLVFDGPVVAPGDSGSPLVVAGDALGVPGGAGERFVIGVLFGGVGSALHCGFTQPPFQITDLYSPTFSALTGDWIDSRLADFDGDGFDDVVDNCPVVPNDQANSNLAAEVTLQLGAGCPDLAGGCDPGEGRTPTTSPGDVAYVDHYHQVYRGDACDPTPVTQLTFHTVYPGGPPVPCRICRTSLDGSVICHTDTGTFCSPVLSSGMLFDSWIGNVSWDAPPEGGGTGPAFCPCSSASDSGVETLRTCQAVNGCVLADHLAFPPYDPTKRPFHDLGWLTPTRMVTSTTRVRFADVPTTHTQPTLIGPAPPPIEQVWDFPFDRPRFGVAGGSSLTGVGWASVQQFLGAAPTAPDLVNSYTSTTVSYFSTRFVFFFPEPIAHIPPELDSFAWAMWHPAGWAPLDRSADQAPAWLALPFEGSDALPLAQNQDGVQVVVDKFSPDALRLLGDVGRGTSELLVGDDVVAGIPAGASNIPALVVVPGTTTIQGGLAISGGSIVQKKPCFADICPNLPNDPPRAYDATHARLLSLELTAGGGTLTALDVRSALAGVLAQTSVPLRGVIPAEPVAMVWNRIEQMVYVADLVRDGDKKAKKKALRLLRIDATGESLELWRTRAFSQPPRLMLSVSTANEVILSLTPRGADRSEVVTLDAVGAPLRSATVDGRLMAAAIASPAGLSLPLRRRAKGERSNLDLRLVRRMDASVGICGARWLRKHADPDTINALGISVRTCTAGDHDDGTDDDD